MSDSTDRPLRANNLPALNRYITTHDSTGKATFSTTLAEEQPFTDIPPTAAFALAYTTSSTPVSFTSDKDITSYQHYLSQPPGLVNPGGSVCRIVDMKPGATSPMHRTVSLDYGVVLEGEVELVLDSGETRRMRRGDVSVQRGTNHAWRNVSPDGGWVRMLYVLLEAEKVEVAGKELGEDLGDMEGVRRSGS